MFLREEALPAFDAPLRLEDALTTDPADFNRLLEPSYLPGETGYCSLPDGTAYTASLTRFPGCTAAMFHW